jgi:hypothetical protein
MAAPGRRPDGRSVFEARGQDEAAKARRLEPGVIGSPLVAGWIALAAFWSLIAWGLANQELELRGTAIFLALWFGAYIGVDHLPVPYSGLFTPFVALLDVALVLIIFKGDIRIS